MRIAKLGLVGMGLVVLLLCLSSPAEADVSWGLSIGTSFGHPWYHHGYYPYDPWYDGYHGWWHGAWYHHPRPHYWPRRSYSSVGVWIGDCYPSVVGTTVVVDRSSVGSARDKALDPPNNPAPEVRISEAVRKRISEQLKILEIGNKKQRIEAIRELAAFSSDNEVRTALEDVLLTDPDPELRKEAAVAFGKTENPLVVAALTEAKENDPDRAVRQAAYRSIIMIEGY